jgi:hypothetical protein
MKTTKIISWVLAFVILFALLPASASADRRGRGVHRERSRVHSVRRGDHHVRSRVHSVWRGDIRHFRNHDFNRWRSGHWNHGYHDGRLGWWWVVSDLWYFYPQLVYPYPDPYTPPPVVVVQPTPQVQVPSAPPPTQYWYYCDQAKGYYPYVPNCPGGWRMVPATPPDVPAR